MCVFVVCALCVFLCVLCVLNVCVVVCACVLLMVLAFDCFDSLDYVGVLVLPFVCAVLNGVYSLLFCLVGSCLFVCFICFVGV